MSALVEALAAAPGRLLAVLDGARDPAIHAWAAANDGRCLYQDVGPVLSAVAPWVVDLRGPGDERARWFLERGWGRAWGVLFATRSADADAATRHLRKLLKVRLEGGGRVYFRFYDPRVLRLYLPTCRPDEVEQVLGPLDAYLYEDDAGALCRFMRAGCEVVTSTAPVTPAAPAAPAPAGARPAGGSDGRAPAGRAGSIDPAVVVERLRSARARLAGDADAPGVADEVRRQAAIVERAGGSDEALRAALRRLVQRLDGRGPPTRGSVNAALTSCLIALKAYG